MVNETREQLHTQILSIREELQASDFNPNEWLNKQLNIEVLMFNTDKRFLGAEILCCCGGPDIRIDTRWNQIEGHWGSDNLKVSYENQGLNEFLEEIYGQSYAR